MIRGMIMRNQVDNPFSCKPFNSQDLGDILFLGLKKKKKKKLGLQKSHSLVCWIHFLNCRGSNTNGFVK